MLTLEKTYLKATSEDDFYSKLKKEKLEIYSRNGNPTGVTLNRKYRFSTLGFTQERLNKLKLEFSLTERERELEEIQQEQRKKEKDLDR